MNEMQLLMKVSKDDDWFRQHYDELREKYVDEFVAVEEGEVVDHGESMEALIEELKGKGKDPALLLIKRVYKKNAVIIL